MSDKSVPRPGVGFQALGFKEAKRLLLAALESGDIQHEVRDVQDEKNLLAIGDVSIAEVKAMVLRCKGTQYSSSPHHMDRGTEVHVFRPVVPEGDKLVEWYLKCYFRGSAWFISVHPSW